MKRLVCLLALVLATAAVASSCDATDPAAATVNGVDISQASLNQELNAINNSPAYVQGIQASLPNIQIPGAGADTLSQGFVGQVLQRRIVFELVAQEVAKRHVHVSPAAQATAKQTLVQQLGSGDATAGQKVYDSFPRAYRLLLVKANAQLTALGNALNRAAGQSGTVTEADVRRYYDQNPDKFKQTCVSHILVGDKATADRLRAQIEGGADFATVAKANSTDTGSAQQGGSLGCNPAGTFDPQFEAGVDAATTGQVTQPVHTQFGYHLILVTDRKVVPYSQVKSQIAQQLQQQQQDPLSNWVAKAFDGATILVNPIYGRWDRRTRAIVPPSGPVTTTTTPTAAGQVPTQQVPTQQVPTQQAPTQQAPAQQAPSGQSTQQGG